MSRCPGCSYENVQGASYCERCGSFLASAANYTNPEEYKATYRAAREVHTPPPPYGLQGPISDYQYQVPPEYMQSASFGYQPAMAEAPKKRHVGNVILGVVLYLWGVFWIAFGLAGGMLYQASSTIIGLVFIGSCVIGLLVMIPVLIFRKNPQLRGKVRLLWAIALTLITFLVLFATVGGLAAVMHFEKTPIQYYIMGAILVIYGFIVATVANW